MVNSIPISVVIPSIQGTARLRMILEVLTAQTKPGGETLVLDA